MKKEMISRNCGTMGLIYDLPRSGYLLEIYIVAQCMTVTLSSRDVSAHFDEGMFFDSLPGLRWFLTDAHLGENSRFVHSEKVDCL